MTAPEAALDAPLNARLSELVQYAQNTRQQLETFVQTVPASLQNQRAEPERWSVTENLEHLAMIEDGIGRLLSSMAKELRADNALEAETSSLLGSLDQYAVPASNAKLVAPDRYVPTGQLSTEDALEKLRGIRLRLLEGVRKANGLDLTKRSAPHPYFGPLNGYQWLLLIGQHEMRHLNQMKDAVQKLSAADAPKGNH